MSQKTTIGTCGNCGGPVEQFTYLHTTGPWPPPKCVRCGAVPADPYGPRIPMRPKAKPVYPNPEQESE